MCGEAEISADSTDLIDLLSLFTVQILLFKNLEHCILTYLLNWIEFLTLQTLNFESDPLCVNLCKYIPIFLIIRDIEK